MQATNVFDNLSGAARGMVRIVDDEGIDHVGIGNDFTHGGVADFRNAEAT